MTSDRIKANHAKEVKPASRSGSLFRQTGAALLGFGFAFTAYAADTSPPPDLPPPVADAAYSGGSSLDDFSSGDTKKYQVEILKRAGTSAIFLFGNSSHSQPKVGKILLLKKDAEPVMAVRVLRSDSTKKRFAARAIKFYGTNSKTMKIGEALTVFERSDGAPQPVAPPSVTPDAIPIELDPPADVAPPIEPIPEPAPPPFPEPAPPPLPEPAPPPAPLTTEKAPTALEPPTAPKVTAPKIPAKITPPPIPTPTPTSEPTSTPAKKPTAPTISRPPPVRPPIPEIPRPDAGAGPGMDLTAPPPPVPDPSTPETTIPSTDGNAPPTAPTSKTAPATDTVRSALSAPTQAPAPQTAAAPSTDAMLQELEVQTAPKADAPPPDAPPPDSGSQELSLDAPSGDAPPPDPEAPPDPNNVTELDTSGLESQAQENPPIAEGEPPPDTETDAPPPESPEPEEAPLPEIAPADEQDDSTLGMAIEEVYPIDSNSQGLTFSFGAFRNNGPPDNPNAVYFFGGGLRYALMLGHMIFAQGARVQDSFALEPGIFYYKLVNFISAAGGDTFTLVPLIGTLRYTLMFGETFSFFLYGGLMYNYVAQASGPEGQTFDDAKATLGSTLPAVGAGMIFRVGPNWDIRLDLGTDVAQAGLMLRF